MSAAARPKRWGVSRQAKGQEIDPTSLNFLPYLTEAAIEGTWDNLGKQKEKEMTSIKGLRLMDQNWSQPMTLKMTLSVATQEREWFQQSQRSWARNRGGDPGAAHHSVVQTAVCRAHV
jgi:hypothetical protein